MADEVISSIDLLDGLVSLLGREQELWGMSAALGELDERALCVPPENRRRVGGGVGAEELEEDGVELSRLCLRNT